MSSFNDERARPSAKSEVARVCRLVDAGLEAAAGRLLAGPEVMPISTAMVERASHAGSASLPSLDAIQLATALSLADDREALVTYDRQLPDAAELERLPVETPV